MKVAFLVNDLQLSGGIGVVVAHARQLAAQPGVDVTLVLVREQEVPHWGYESLEHLHVTTLAESRLQRFDVAVATWWETTLSLFLVPAERYAYFVQSLEDRFYYPDDPESTFAGLTVDLPLAFLTEARWIADTLRELRPDAPVHLVRNGIDKEVFAPLDEVQPNVDGPLRILVEGYANVWFKNVNTAIAATRLMAEAHELTVVGALARPAAGRWRDARDRAAVAPRDGRALRRRPTSCSSCRASRGCSARRWRASTAGRRA